MVCYEKGVFSRVSGRDSKVYPGLWVTQKQMLIIPGRHLPPGSCARTYLVLIITNIKTNIYYNSVRPLVFKKTGGPLRPGDRL